MSELAQSDLVYSSRSLKLWNVLVNCLDFLYQLFLKILRAVAHHPLLSTSSSSSSAKAISDGFKPLPVTELPEIAAESTVVTVEITPTRSSGEGEVGSIPRLTVKLLAFSYLSLSPSFLNLVRFGETAFILRIIKVMGKNESSFRVWISSIFVKSSLNHCRLIVFKSHFVWWDESLFPLSCIGFLYMDQSPDYSESYSLWGLNFSCKWSYKTATCIPCLFLSQSNEKSELRIGFVVLRFLTWIFAGSSRLGWDVSECVWVIKSNFYYTYTSHWSWVEMVWARLHIINQGFLYNKWFYYFLLNLQ